MPLAVDFQGGVSSAWSNVITFVPKLAAALLIILVGYLLARSSPGSSTQSWNGSASTARWNAAGSGRP
jgi:Conserved TM helix